jgi:hypothetical protein
VVDATVKRLLCCGFWCTCKVMRQVYQCWWRICWEANFFSPGSNITSFTFYIHLWPIYWFSITDEITQIYKHSQYIFSAMRYEIRSSGKITRTFLSLHIEYLTSHRLHRKHQVQQPFLREEGCRDSKSDFIWGEGEESRLKWSQPTELQLKSA